MSFTLNWTIEGDKQLSRKLLILSDHMKDLTPPMRDSVVMLKELFSGDVFQTEGKAIQEQWSPLKKAYALRKEQRYPGKGILEATGAMRNNFKMLWSSDIGVVSNDTDYFKYHQSNAPRSKLPRRVMMNLGDKQKTDIVRIFQKHIQQAIQSS